MVEILRCPHVRRCKVRIVNPHASQILAVAVTNSERQPTASEVANGKFVVDFVPASSTREISVTSRDPVFVYYTSGSAANISATDVLGNTFEALVAFRDAR